VSAMSGACTGSDDQPPLKSMMPLAAREILSSPFLIPLSMSFIPQHFDIGLQKMSWQSARQVKVRYLYLILELRKALLSRCKPNHPSNALG